MIMLVCCRFGLFGWYYDCVWCCWDVGCGFGSVVGFGLS